MVFSVINSLVNVFLIGMLKIDLNHSTSFFSKFFSRGSLVVEIFEAKDVNSGKKVS